MSQKLKLKSQRCRESKCLLRQVDMQHKNRKTQQGQNSTHRLYSRRDKHAQTVENTHFQLPFSRPSTCHQCFNRGQSCEGTSWNGGVLAFIAAKRPTGKVTSADLWGLWADQKRIIASISQSLVRHETSSCLDLGMRLKGRETSAPRGCATGAKLFQRPRNICLFTNRYASARLVTIFQNRLDG